MTIISLHWSEIYHWYGNQTLRLCIEVITLDKYLAELYCIQYKMTMDVLDIHSVFAQWIMHVVREQRSISDADCPPSQCIQFISFCFLFLTYSDFVWLHNQVIMSFSSDRPSGFMQLQYAEVISWFCNINAVQWRRSSWSSCYSL